MSGTTEPQPTAGTAPLAPEPDTAGELDKAWDDPPGLWGQLTGVQNDKIGLRLVLTGFFFAILGGSFDSLVMRLQLAVPENDLVSPQLYNELFTNHGSVTMFLVILPIFEGFAIMVLPLMLGTREMPFPRLGAFAYWTFLMGGGLYYSSTLFQLVPDAGWFAYTPLSGPEYSPDLAIDFWILALGVAEIGAIAAAIEIIIGILKMRAPGMTLSRLPLFAWALLAMSFLILFGFSMLIIGDVLLELDRAFGTQFFDPQQGGSSLLWQHLFWLFGHPEVYIQFLPAAGIMAMIVPVFVRHRPVGYTWLVASFVAIAFLSFALWAHHMFAVGLPPLVLSFFAASSMAISIPAGVQVFAWLATIWRGKPMWKTPFLFFVGFLVIFVIGGITGVMVASVPFDLQAHDSYFVVGHLHYVLIGGVVFPIFAGIYYWFPKFTGRMMDERLGRWNFWLLFVGVNTAFFPMHQVGLMGMPRRVYTYGDGLGWGIFNLISTIGVLIIFPGIGVFVWNVVRSYRKGEPATANPWGADTLEWAVPSPPLQHGWTTIPIVRSRHPLWDQEELDKGPEDVERFVQGLARWPLNWRAAVVVGTADARPQEVFRVAGPSIWPLVAACGIVLAFLGGLLKLVWVIALGALIALAAAIVWNWPRPPEMDPDEEDDFEQEYGVPVNAHGSVVVAQWATGLMILFVGVLFSAFLLSYFYLRLENAAWPPPGVELPSVVWTVVAAVLMVASAVVLGLARGRLNRGDRRSFLLGLTATLVLALVAVGVQVVDLAGLGFAWTDHAYGSVVYTTAGFVLLVVGGAMVMLGLTLGWTVMGKYTVRRHAPVTNVVRVWVASTVMWLIGFGTLYAGPYLV